MNTGVNHANTARMCCLLCFLQRRVSVISITLSKEALDTSHIGYQAPLPADQVRNPAQPTGHLQHAGAQLGLTVGLTGISSCSWSSQPGGPIPQELLCSAST